MNNASPQIMSETPLCSNDRAHDGQEEHKMAKIKAPRHLVVRTGGGKQTFWCRMRHPLRNGQVVSRSTGIPVTDIDSAKTFSTALSILIDSKAGWDQRHKAIARNKAVADLYFGLAIAPKDKPDEGVTIDNDLGVCFVGDPEDDGETVPLANALRARKKDREAVSRANQERDAALQREAQKDLQIEAFEARIKELENKIVALTGETDKAPPPMSELVTLYLAGLKGKKGKPVSPTHFRTRERHLKEFWPSKLPSKDIRQIEMPVVDSELTKLTKTLTSKTAHIHLESLKAFLWWCVKMNYVHKNPIEHLEGLDCSPTEKRSALTLAELQKLMKAASPERKILYAVAVATGFRKKELGALRVKDFSSENCTLTLDGEHTKNKKSAKQLIPTSLANQLAAWIRETKREPDDSLLEVSSHIDRYFKQDLGEVPEGRVLVFHSLRHSTSTILSAAGATVKEQTEIMRHSDPRLTINQYTDVVDERMRVLAEALGAALTA